MNKNIGKKFFTVICAGLIVTSIAIFSLGKNKTKLEDLYGNRNELEDVSILLQSRNGMYETDEIRINKGGMTVDSMAKQAVYNFNLSKKNIEGRQILEDANHGYIEYTDALLEDNDRLGSVLISREYTENNDYSIYANIKIKYNNSDKVESYKIHMDNQDFKGSGLVYSSVPISIDKDNMYIVTLGSYYTEDYLEERNNASYEDYADDSFNKTELNLYKVNLSKKTSKHILNKDYDGEKIYIKEDVYFANNNKSYFSIKEKDNDGSYKSSLFEFDVITEEINIIDLGIKDDSITKFSVDDNKLLLIYNDIEMILVDLENSSVEHLKHIRNDYSGDILQARRLGNKIYFITSEYSEEDDYTGECSYCFFVFDEKKNEILYEGRIKQKSSHFAQFGIVKNDEL